MCQYASYILVLLFLSVFFLDGSGLDSDIVDEPVERYVTSEQQPVPVPRRSSNNSLTRQDSDSSETHVEKRVLENNINSKDKKNGKSKIPVKTAKDGKKEENTIVNQKKQIKNQDGSVKQDQEILKRSDSTEETKIKRKNADDEHGRFELQELDLDSIQEIRPEKFIDPSTWGRQSTDGKSENWETMTESTGSRGEQWDTSPSSGVAESSVKTSASRQEFNSDTDSEGSPRSRRRSPGKRRTLGSSSGSDVALHEGAELSPLEDDQGTSLSSNILSKQCNYILLQSSCQ